MTTIYKIKLNDNDKEDIMNYFLTEEEQMIVDLAKQVAQRIKRFIYSIYL